MPKKEEQTHIKVKVSTHKKLVDGAFKDNNAKVFIFTEKVIKAGLTVVGMK